MTWEPLCGSEGLGVSPLGDEELEVVGEQERAKGRGQRELGDTQRPFAPPSPRPLSVRRA